MASNEDLTSTITGLENQTWQALQHEGKAFLPFLSDDCIMLFPLGLKVSHRTTPDLKTVMMSDAFVPWRSYQMSEVEVTPVGPEGAVISYRAEATRRGVEEPFKAMISSTWRKDSSTGKWLLCVHQQTPFTDINAEDLAAGVEGDEDDDDSYRRR